MTFTHFVTGMGWYSRYLFTGPPYMEWLFHQLPTMRISWAGITLSIRPLCATRHPNHGYGRRSAVLECGKYRTLLSRDASAAALIDDIFQFPSAHAAKALPPTTLPPTPNEMHAVVGTIADAFVDAVGAVIGAVMGAVVVCRGAVVSAA